MKLLLSLSIAMLVLNLVAAAPLFKQVNSAATKAAKATFYRSDKANVNYIPLKKDEQALANLYYGQNEQEVGKVQYRDQAAHKKKASAAGYLDAVHLGAKKAAKAAFYGSDEANANYFKKDEQARANYGSDKAHANRILRRPPLMKDELARANYRSDQEHAIFNRLG